MTIFDACGWSLGRSAGVALVAALLCRRLHNWLQTRSPGSRRGAWGTLTVTLLFPSLLAGYAYTGGSLQLLQLVPGIDGLTGGWEAARDWILAHNDLADEVLLDLLLLARALPVGLVVLLLAPRSSVSSAALHCRRLVWKGADPGWRRWPTALAWRARAGWRAPLALLLLVWLFTFQEFELASLLKRPAWTVWLFDAQVGGLSIAQSMRMTAGPAAIQLVLMAAAWPLLRTPGAPRGTIDPRETPSPTSWLGGLAGWGVVVWGVGITALAPILLVGRDTLDGLLFLARNAPPRERLLTEISVGLGLALAGALLATGLVRLGLRGGALRRTLLWLGLAPGLCGSLLVSLSLVALLQYSFLHRAYKTPVSYLLGLALALLPRAWLLAILLRETKDSAALSLAGLLQRSPNARLRRRADGIAWRLGGRGTFWSVALLTWWGYLDLTVAYLLGPVSIVSVPVLLYNHMHFGKNAVLAATTFVAVAAPALVFAAAAALRPVVVRWFWS